MVYFSTFVIALLFFPLMSVFSKSMLSKANYEVEFVKDEISVQEKSNESLQMKINELASLENLESIAKEKGLTPKGTAERIQKVLKTYGLPFECGLTLGTLTEAIALDKKNLNGNLNVILLHEIGDSYIEATDIQFFAETARLV